MAKKKPIPPEYRPYAGQPFCVTKHITPEQATKRKFAMQSRGYNAYYAGADRENQSYYGESVEEIYSRNKLIKGFYHVRAYNPETEEYLPVGDVIFAGKQMYTEAPYSRCRFLENIVREEAEALQRYKEKHGTG